MSIVTRAPLKTIGASLFDILPIIPSGLCRLKLYSIAASFSGLLEESGGELAAGD